MGGCDRRTDGRTYRHTDMVEVLLMAKTSSKDILTCSVNSQYVNNRTHNMSVLLYVTDSPFLRRYHVVCVYNYTDVKQ